MGIINNEQAGKYSFSYIKNPDEKNNEVQSSKSTLSSKTNLASGIRENFPEKLTSKLGDVWAGGSWRQRQPVNMRSVMWEDGKVSFAGKKIPVYQQHVSIRKKS